MTKLDLSQLVCNAGEGVGKYNETVDGIGKVPGQGHLLHESQLMINATRQTRIFR